MMPSNIMTKAAVSRLATWRQIIEFSAIKNIVWSRQKYLNTTKWSKKKSKAGKRGRGEAMFMEQKNK